MMEEKETKTKSKINYRRLNEILKLSHHVLKIFYILICIVCVYVVLKVCQELKVVKIILDIIGILSPLFIGMIIAWTFNPVINYLQKKGIKRSLGIIIVYVLLLGIVALVIGSLLPILYDQIVSFANSIPNIIDNAEGYINGFLNHFNNIEGLDMESIKAGVIEHLESFGSDISSTLPTYVINIVSGFISGIASLVVGLIIGFFLLLRKGSISEIIIDIVPKKWRKDTKTLLVSINGSLRSYLMGVIIDAIVIFIICSLVFSLVGLRAPLLFAVFCAITNVIPYVGPYIGAVPAVIVGFSMSPTIGILTTIAIIIIQFIEGNFLQEYIMSKTTKLHPVTIITGLLVFGHFWGIVGMVISTPIIAVIKQIYLFFDEKYDFFNSNGGEEDE